MLRSLSEGEEGERSVVLVFVGLDGGLGADIYPLTVFFFPFSPPFLQ